MSLRTQINEALKDAMRAKDEKAVGAVRLIISEMKKRDIEARPSGNADGISDDQIVTMMQSMIKQRRESMDMYKKGNRQDLVDQESGEITVIERFMPKQMSEDEMKAAISKTVAAVGASSIKDMGKVMAELKKNYAGQMDFAAVGALVKSQLAA